MITVTSLVLAAIIAGIFWFLWKPVKYSGELPPGPKGLPILGNLLSFRSKAYLTLGEWVEDYGHIFKVKILHYKLIVISDPKLAREAFSNAALSGRPDFKLFNLIGGPDCGLTNSSGRAWVEQRRFTLRTLREFGFGKQQQQNLVLEEVRDMVDWFKSIEGKPTKLERPFELATLNLLWVIMTGKRFNKEDHVTKDFMTRSMEIMDKLMQNPLAIVIPNVCEKFPKLTGWNRVMEVVESFEKYVTDPVMEQKQDYDPKNEPQDFEEAYMKEISKTTDPTSSFYKEVGEKNQRTVTAELFGAGSMTTSNTLSFALLYLCKHPDIQKKLHEEIDRVVGSSRQPVLDDRKDMPYTVAVMYEALRKSSINPLGIMHAATETTTVAGYTIPKGYWLAVNHYFIHHDPAIWGDPENFRPERFLTEDGKSVINSSEALIPFSVGKRVCIGEQIAKDSFFLFLTGIMQRFSIRLDPDFPVPPEDSDNPLFKIAPTFSVIVTHRTGC